MPKKPISPVMRSILTDFNRKPVKRRDEFGDREGFVLKRGVEYYDQRMFNALVARGLIDYFKRCLCEYSCSCGNNGYHITPAGRAELAKKL